MARSLKLKENLNNTFDTDEILWLLNGHENMSALEFVCRFILNVKPEEIFEVFEYDEN